MGTEWTQDEASDAAKARSSGLERSRSESDANGSLPGQAQWLLTLQSTAGNRAAASLVKRGSSVAAAAHLALRSRTGNRPSSLLVTAIHRAIDVGAFARLNHSLIPRNPRPIAILTRDADNVTFGARRAAAAGIEVTEVAPNNQGVLAPVTGVWVAVDGAQLQAEYSWHDERIEYRLPNEPGRVSKTRGNDQLQSGPGAAGQTLDQFAGDELAMVHHSSGGGSEPHLTVENAHIGALHHLMDMGTIGGFDKGGKTKPQHEELMAGYGSARTDNLNFFAAGGDQAVHQLSLAQYLIVIRRAMDQIADVPPVYGVEVVRSANHMAQLHGMNPATLFLPRGEGQEQQLFKAVMNMHLMGLIAMPPEIVGAFSGYVPGRSPNGSVRQDGVPQLTDPDTRAVVRKGEAAWNSLERSLVNQHLPTLIAHLQGL